jgi:hypothetical protein
MVQIYQGCRVCGQNVVYSDGKCNAVIHSGIRDLSYRPPTNVAQGVKGDQSVLFEDYDWRGKAFHIPINNDESIFDNLDDTIAPINHAATTLGENAIAVASPISMETTNGDTETEDAIAEANEMPYVHVFDDESEVSHAAGIEPPELPDDDEKKKENALYARDLPTSNMASWVISDVRTDTTFTELWETYLLHMEDTREEVTIQ